MVKNKFINNLKNIFHSISLKLNFIFIFTLIFFSFILSLNFNSLSFISLKTTADNTKNVNYGSSFKENETYSIFIKEPTYSFVYSNNLYFYDSFDKNLKIYSIEENKFKSNYLNLTQYGELIDVEILDNYLFSLFLKDNSNIIVKIDLTNLSSEIILSQENIQNNSFIKLNITSFNTNYLITVTPKIDNSNNIVKTNPKIFVIDKNSNSLINTKEITLNSSLNQSIKTSLFKIILYSSNESNNYFNLLLVCEKELFATNISNSQILENTSYDMKYTNFNEYLDSKQYDTSIFKDYSVLSTNLMNINGNFLLSVSYKTTTLNNNLDSYTSLYSINLSQFTNESTFNLATTIDTPITKYVCAFDSGLSYPNNQTICFAKIEYTSETPSFTVSEVKNPNISVIYYENNEFIYSKTNKSTEILATPWSSNETITIAKDTDVIIIGDGFIESQNSTFNDYKYCIYTSLNTNYLGFIKSENLTQKDSVDIPEKSKICKVIPNTPLYSLPTKIFETISDNLVSNKIMDIQENSKIEIIDMICGYTSNSTLFVMVKVNNNEIGYIDFNQIQNKNEFNIHITNNATVKLDNANVYLNESTDSPIIQTLKSGTRIQINSSRSQKNGLTHITFTDEYGNVFSGYLLSDYIEIDGWTNMQILGSIFIAVNIGVLILILLFKKKRLITKPIKDITASKNDETEVNNN